MQPTGLLRFLKKKPKYAMDHFFPQIMPLLVSVDELTLLPEEHDHGYVSCPLISGGLLVSLAPRLRKLNFRGTIGMLQRILSGPLQYPRCNFKPLPSLTHLVLSFQVRRKWRGFRIINIAVFVAFLQCLEETLESLSVSIPKQVTPFLPKLPHFRRLEYLEIRLVTYQITPEEGVAFVSFLSTHREYLKTLSLSLYPERSSTVRIYKAFCNISFPFLHTLALDRTQSLVELTQAFPHVPNLQSFVSGGRDLDKETITKIHECASPSVPIIALGGNPFDSQLDVQLVV